MENASSGDYVCLYVAWPIVLGKKSVWCVCVLGAVGICNVIVIMFVSKR